MTSLMYFSKVKKVKISSKYSNIFTRFLRIFEYIRDKKFNIRIRILDIRIFVTHCFKFKNFQVQRKDATLEILIVYRTGKLNYFADGTSRQPSNLCQPEDDNCEGDLAAEVSVLLVKKLNLI